jgi:hypothetical protein
MAAPLLGPTELLGLDLEPEAVQPGQTAVDAPAPVVFLQPSHGEIAQRPPQGVDRRGEGVEEGKEGDGEGQGQQQPMEVEGDPRAELEARLRQNVREHKLALLCVCVPRPSPLRAAPSLGPSAGPAVCFEWYCRSALSL